MNSDEVDLVYCILVSEFFCDDVLILNFEEGEVYFVFCMSVGDSWIVVLMVVFFY